MRLCLFGPYVRSTDGIPSGSTGDLIKEICRSQGFETAECHDEYHSFGSAIKAYVRLFLKHRKIDYDVMIIPYLRRGRPFIIPFARLVSKGP